MASRPTLQFGHGGDAVETVSRPHAGEGCGTLQFGHGGDAVETRIDRGQTAILRRFNSATAVMPWKPDCNSYGTDPGCCFNSATAVMPWKLFPLDLRPRGRVASIRPRR